MDDVTLPAGITLPQGMRYHILPAGTETLGFWGEFLDSVTTDDGERLRWAELCLYGMLDTNPGHDEDCPEQENRGMYGKRMWLLYTIGHSLLYHALGGCNKGVKTAARDFPAKAESADDTEPCETCRPADWRSASPDEEFRLEVTWYSHVPCQTAGKVITSLSRCANCRDRAHEGVRCYKCGCTAYSGMLTSPGFKLIQQVREKDAEIARAASRTKRF